uniref:WDR72 n=2 Tax=Macrostomum lignano TaxID=282301 RepID=A0A1I8JCZ0_9PLAT
MPAKKKRPSTSSWLLQEQLDSDSETDVPPPAAALQGLEEDEASNGPVFTIKNEESSEIVEFAHPGSDGGKRYSSQLRWSVAQSCTPTQSSLDFYARRKQSQSQLSRRSQLAEELSQSEITRSLVSSRCSSSSVVPKSIKKASGARSQPRHSMRYPSVGSLDLEKFLSQSSPESDDDELNDSAAKKMERQSKDVQDRNK